MNVFQNLFIENTIFIETITDNARRHHISIINFKIKELYIYFNKA